MKSETLLKSSHTFIDKNENEHIIKIFGTFNSMKNLSDKNFTQYFVDSTYKCIPAKLEKFKALLLIIGYDSSIDSFSICCAALLSHEDSETLSELYYYLKTIWKFIPSKITYDFALGNINAIDTVFENDNVLIIPCFFHLIQAWWRKLNKLGFRKKNIIKKTKVLVLNLKLLSFMNHDKALEFYKEIKNEYNNEFESFFEYFEDTWFSIEEGKDTRYDFSLWSYDGKFKFDESRRELISKKNLEKYVFLSNNACESLNHLINSFIAINNKVSITRFEIIIKTLFVRLDVSNSLKDQNVEHIDRKCQLSDLLFELIKKGYGCKKRMLTYNDLKSLKNCKKESDIFKLNLNEEEID